MYFLRHYFLVIQPEVVPPSSLKKKKKSRKRHSSPKSNTITGSGGGGAPFDSSSSSTTEMGGNDTDGASDVEELPTDEPETDANSSCGGGGGSKLKMSQSSIDLGHHLHPERPFLETSGSGTVKTHSQPDLLQLDPATESSHFYEELLEEFDQNSLENPENIEESLSTKSNDRALQIIQENSAILEKLLSKKSSPCKLGDPPLVNNGGNGPGNVDSNGGSALPTIAVSPTPPVAPMTISKRKISHTSSNGSSSSNPSVKNHSITLQSNPATKPITFNPFPNSARANRKPKEVGRKLGLYK